MATKILRTNRWNGKKKDTSGKSNMGIQMKNYLHDDSIKSFHSVKDRVIAKMFSILNSDQENVDKIIDVIEYLFNSYHINEVSDIVFNVTKSSNSQKEHRHIDIFLVQDLLDLDTRDILRNLFVKFGIMFLKTNEKDYYSIMKVSQEYIKRHIMHGSFDLTFGRLIFPKYLFVLKFIMYVGFNKSTSFMRGKNVKSIDARVEYFTIQFSSVVSKMNGIDEYAFFDYTDYQLVQYKDFSYVSDTVYERLLSNAFVRNFYEIGAFIKLYTLLEPNANSINMVGSTHINMYTYYVYKTFFIDNADITYSKAEIVDLKPQIVKESYTSQINLYRNDDHRYILKSGNNFMRDVKAYAIDNHIRCFIDSHHDSVAQFKYTGGRND